MRTSRIVWSLVGTLIYIRSAHGCPCPPSDPALAPRIAFTGLVYRIGEPQMAPGPQTLERFYRHAAPYRPRAGHAPECAITLPLTIARSAIGPVWCSAPGLYKLPGVDALHCSVAPTWAYNAPPAPP